MNNIATEIAPVLPTPSRARSTRIALANRPHP